MMLTVHDWISGRAHRIRMLERLLDRITKTSQAWITTVGEIAAHHAHSINNERFAVSVRSPDNIAQRRFGSRT